MKRAQGDVSQSGLVCFIARVSSLGAYTLSHRKLGGTFPAL